MRRTFRNALVFLAVAIVGALGCTSAYGTEEQPDASYDASGDASAVDVTAADAGATGDAADGGPESAALLAENQNGVRALVQDATNLYWAAGGDIMTVSKAGAVAPRKVGSLAGASVLAVEPGVGANVYVGAGTLVNAFPKAGGALGTLVMMLVTGRAAVAIGVDGTDVFVLDYDENADNSVVRRAPKDGGTAVVVSGASANVMLLGVDPLSAVWINEVDQNNRAVFEMPSGGAPTSHGTAPGYAVLPDIRKLTLNPTKLYWLDSTVTGSSLRSHQRGSAASTPTELATFSSVEEPIEVAVSGDLPFVLVVRSLGASSTEGEVFAIKGGARSSVVQKLENPSGIVADQQYLYVAEDKPFSKGTIRKFPLPK